VCSRTKAQVARVSALGAVDAGLEAEVEVTHCHPAGQVGQAQARAHAALIALACLGLHEPLDPFMPRSFLADRLGDLLVESLGSMEKAQPLQLFAEAVQFENRLLRAHRATSIRRW